ncbi:Saccharopine dehydrogenase [Serratia rubidaea]|uniref:Saccharopine dehydrogenase n=2 Tax=Serratia rubidaea TaxID=61652 RepID=A0A3S5AMZ1_SERRU|nr:saccharopine dehydrogenase NADP-binding domain-containing protein [Serratia rubidaea]VEI66958.1 Saccharopine dehydrogenase [Serratia rubidaea]
MKKLMIYGAAGYTGAMAAERAASAGLNLVLAGRTQNRATLEALAGRFGAEVRLFSLDEPEAIGDSLADINVLLNAAGPFIHTANPLMLAAICVGTHYLDFSAELDTYRQALALDGPARAVGVMLLPGCGGSVAMLGCLAARVVARVAAPRKLSIALHVAGTMSRGSLTSANQNLVTKTFRLLNGELVERSPAEVRDFDFGEGPRSSFPITLPDLLTLHQMTGVPDIETFVHISAGVFPSGELQALPAGPDAQERAENRYHAVVEVTEADGSMACARLDTVNGYTFTAMAAAEAARRVLTGEVRAGFQTPAGLFGQAFAESIADTRIVDTVSGLV